MDRPANLPAIDCLVNVKAAARTRSGVRQCLVTSLARMKIHIALAAVVLALASGPAAAQSVAQTPDVHLDQNWGRSAQALAVTGAGFAPNEAVDVSLGDQSLTTVTADAEGRLLHASISIPYLNAGDYTLSFVGQTSRTPVSVGYSVQGVRPWVVLHNYYVAPQSGVGFDGNDFAPGETVAVYLNSMLTSPVAQVTADGEGRFAMANALSPANLTGANQLIFVGQQSQTQLTVTFTVAAQ
jgi:hypothetical protein